MKMLFYLLCLEIIQIIKNEKIIPIIYDISTSRPCIRTLFPTEKTYDNCTYLNTLIPKTVIQVYRFNNYITIPDNESFFINLSSSYKAWNYTTDIMINTTIIPNTKIVLFQSGSYYCHDTGLSLTYKFENEQQSIMHILYNSHLIDKKLFALKPYATTLYLGGLPNDEPLNYSNYGYCKIDKKYSTWGCNLTSVVYNQNTYSFNNYSIFDIADDDFIWSFEFFDFMLSKIFTQEVKNKKCKVINHYSLSCENDLDKFDENMTFEIGGIKIKLKIVELFEEKSRKKFSLFRNYSIHNTILVGYRFFELFNLSIFDYDKGEVHFYSDIDRIDINIYNGKIIISIYIFIILSCGTMFVILILKKNINKSQIR